jgi:hypothetical protein
VNWRGRLYHRLRRLRPGRYRDARDAGVYLPGVDSSELEWRRPVSHPPFGVGSGSAVLLILGQSNAANHGQGRFAAGPQVCNFNPFNGRIYPAADPLLGATGGGGSPWCAMSDALIARGFADEILLVPVAVGGSTVADWAPGGPRNHRLMYALDRLAKHGSAPTHILWHQGEADALYGTSGDDYVASFDRFAGSLRACGITGPIYVAIATYFGIPPGHERQQATIAAAQARLIDPAAGILQGPCTDLIRDRYDDCHFDETGLRKHAAAWVEVLMGARSA